MPAQKTEREQAAIERALHTALQAYEDYAIILLDRACSWCEEPGRVPFQIDSQYMLMRDGGPVMQAIARGVLTFENGQWACEYIEHRRPTESIWTRMNFTTDLKKKDGHYWFLHQPTSVAA